MYEQIGTAGGLGMGGMLGQMLSAPRRAPVERSGRADGSGGARVRCRPPGPDLWHGPQFGLGQGPGAWRRGRNRPPDLRRRPSGRSHGQDVRAATGAEAAAAGEVQSALLARRTAQEGLAARAGIEQQTMRRYASQASELERNFDIPSIAGGQTRSYQTMAPGLAQDLENSGMGQMSAQGTFDTLGQDRLPGIQQVRQRFDAGAPSGVPTHPYQGRITGSYMDYGELPLNHPTVPQSMAMPGQTPAQNLYRGMEPLLPDELGYLQQQAQAHVGNNPDLLLPGWQNNNGTQNLRGPLPSYGTPQLMDDFAGGLSKEANATRPMPSLGNVHAGSDDPCRRHGPGASGSASSRCLRRIADPPAAGAGSPEDAAAGFGRRGQDRRGGIRRRLRGRDDELQPGVI